VATPVDSVAAVTGRFVASCMASWASGGYTGLNGRKDGEGSGSGMRQDTRGETSASIADDPAEVRTRHIPNGIRYVL